VPNSEVKTRQTMKQTAVEWLHTKLSTCTSEELVGNINNWFEQAKEMEKEQIMGAWIDGNNSDCLSEQDSSDFAKQYNNDK
jgi:hypothetical protein